MNIPIDYAGYESEADRARVRVKSRYEAVVKIETQPALLKALKELLRCQDATKFRDAYEMRDSQSFAEEAARGAIDLVENASAKRKVTNL